MNISAGLALLAWIGAAAPATAQDATQLDDVVVMARQVGAPVWTVRRGDSTLILVGAISGVPGGFRWRPETLEAATARSQRVLYPTEGRFSVNDAVRLVWRTRTISRLPQGTTTADYLPPDLQARLEVLMRNEEDGWRTRSLTALGLDLMERGGRQRGGSGPVTAVRNAARRAGVPGEPVGVMRGDDLVEGLISDAPERYVPCIAAAVAAAEAGPEGARVRLGQWRERRVPELLENPLERAYDLCWPSGDPEITLLQREQWRYATQMALSRPEVTVGVVAVRVLAEPGGVLDQLEAQGLDIEGPTWKTNPWAGSRKETVTATAG